MFYIDWKSVIGKYEAGIVGSFPGFGTGTMTAYVQALGIVPEFQELFSSSQIIKRTESGICLNIS